MREQSQRYEQELFGGGRSQSQSVTLTSSGLWVRQRSPDGQSIMNAKTSRQQGIELNGVTVFTLDDADHFLGRIDASQATLFPGYWRLEDARVYVEGIPPQDHATYDLKTNLTRAQAQETFATPETVPFWELSSFIRFAENAGLAAVGYRLQYYQLLALPFYLVAMVLLAAVGELAAVPLRRRADDDPGRHRCRLPALRDIESVRGFEQGQSADAGARRRVASVCRRGHRPRRPPVPGGRLMAARSSQVEKACRAVSCAGARFARSLQS